MVSRIVCSILGSIILSIGVSTLVTLNYGVPSFDTFVLAVSNLINTSYTNTLRLTQLCILIILIIFKKKFSLTWTELLVSSLSVIIVTLLIDASTFLLKDVIVRNYAWLAFGFIFFIYGITLLVQSDIFLAPNDKILNAISHVTTHTYALYKAICDIAMLAVALTIIKVYGFDISVSTVTIFLTFFTGPFVGMFSKLNNIIVNKFVKTYK